MRYFFYLHPDIQGGLNACGALGYGAGWVGVGRAEDGKGGGVVPSQLGHCRKTLCEYKLHYG